MAAGGSIGAALRYCFYISIKPQPFPYATLLINIAGSFILGIIMALSIKDAPTIRESYKLFLATGICGGFTTFSTFSYENIYLLQAGKYNLAFIYILVSVVAGIGAAWFGFKLINH